LAARSARCDPAPDVPGPDLLPVDDIVRVERSGAVLEPADDRRLQRTQRVARVEPPDGPLLGLRIEGADGDTAPHAAVDEELVVFNIRQPTHDLVVAALALGLDPLLSAVRLLLQGPVVHPPGADLEVEVTSAPLGAIEAWDCGIHRFASTEDGREGESHPGQRAQEAHVPRFSPATWPALQAGAAQIPHPSAGGSPARPTAPSD